jgi:hypothetical protein
VFFARLTMIPVALVLALLVLVVATDTGTET